MNIKTLKNSLKVVTEKLSGAQSVFVGVWVRAGSGNETIDEWGISHFIEHMVFKGTKNRTAQQIAEETDYIGAQSNAFTSRDCTCFYCRTLPEDIEVSFDILSDIYYNPLLAKEDVDLERGVIKEEISMFEDCPEDLVQDRLLAQIYKDNPLGREIAGCASSVDKITSEQMADYMRRYYTSDNTVITVCGDFDEEAVLALAEKYFSKSNGTFSGERMTEPTFYTADCVWRKETEQAHLCITYPSVKANDDVMTYALNTLSNIFGGSMSSRIFRSVREERGLCYSIYSYSSQTAVSGLFGIYAGLNANCIDAAETLIDEEIQKLLKGGVTERELIKGKAQLKAAILMDMENPAYRMNSLGKDVLIYNDMRTPQQIIRDIDSVTMQHVISAAELVFNAPKAVAKILPK